MNWQSKLYICPLSVRACKIESKREVLSVRAWSIKRAGVQSSTYKPRLLRLHVEKVVMKDEFIKLERRVRA